MIRPDLPYSSNKQRCAVCVSLLDSDRRLLVTRRPKYMRKFPWAWVMPGGHIEYGETLEQSVVREMKEETGIGVEILGNGKVRYNGQEGEMKPYFIFESVSMKTRGTEAPFSGHLVIFFQVQLK